MDLGPLSLEISLAFLLVSLVTVKAIGVRHLVLGESHLIDTSDQHYSMTTPTFNQIKWKTATVNANNVFIMTPKCDMIFKQLDKLNGLERTLLETTKSLIASIETDRPKVSANGKTNYSATHADLEKSTRLVSGSVQTTCFESGGYSISKFDDDNFTATKASFPNQWARIYVTSETITFVYRNGGLLMKPLACLMANEKQVLDEMKQVVKKGDPSKQTPRNNDQKRPCNNKQKRARGVRVALKEMVHHIH